MKFSVDPQGPEALAPLLFLRDYAIEAQRGRSALAACHQEKSAVAASQTVITAELRQHRVLRVAFKTATSNWPVLMRYVPLEMGS